MQSLLIDRLSTRSATGLFAKTFLDLRAVRCEAKTIPSASGVSANGMSEMYGCPSDSVVRTANFSVLSKIRNCSCAIEWSFVVDA